MVCQLLFVGSGFADHRWLCDLWGSLLLAVGCINLAFLCKSIPYILRHLLGILNLIDAVVALSTVRVFWLL
jgi:hypothetical protein